MPNVHPAAWVHPDAQLADDVTVGPFAVVEARAEIGPGTVLEPHAVVHAGARPDLARLRSHIGDR